MSIPNETNIPQTPQYCQPPPQSHLCSQAEAEAIREPRGGVVKHASSVGAVEERLRIRLVFRDDALGVGTAVLVNEVQCSIQVVNHLLQLQLQIQFQSDMIQGHEQY